MSTPFGEGSTEQSNNNGVPSRTTNQQDLLFDVSDDVSEADEVMDEFEPAECDLDQDELVEEEEGEDLFGDDMMNDYRRDGEDRYDPTMLDDNDQQELTRGGRQRAEEAMRRREAMEGTEATQPQRTRRADQYYGIGRLLEQDETNEVEETREEGRVRRRRARRLQIHESGSSSAPSLEDVRMSLDELPYYDEKLQWNDAFAGCMKTIFKHFVLCFTDRIEEDAEDDVTVGIYVERLVDVVREDKLTLHVKWEHLQQEFPKLSEWFSFQPLKVFRVFDSAVNDIIKVLYGDLYKQKNVRVRLTHFKDHVEPMTQLDTTTLHQMVAVEGVVVKRSGMIPKIIELYIQCKFPNCGGIVGPVESVDDQFKKTKEKRICPHCNRDGYWQFCREKTVYETLQYLTIQELPSSVAKGQAPVQKEVVVDSDLVDLVRPGDDVILLAYHSAKRNATINSRAGFPILSTNLITNNIIKRTDIKMADLTVDEVEQFHKLARNPHIREKIITSIAPSIWGHRHAKTGLAMAMFGGVRQELQGQDKHSIRGDINVLLVGDPGMAKSQMLKYVNKLIDKSVFTTGKGASAAGLTASMKKDPITGEYSLEGGALVLADTGICLIDEFDKMSEIDRVSIHEAMEAQTISISKAGICTTLRARCSVIAAANPIYGRYDPSLTFSENVTLGDTILSRFDVVAVMRDTPTTIHDTQMAEYITRSHFNSHPDIVREKRLGLAEDDGAHDRNEELDDDFIDGDATIPHEFLAKYLMYARKHCHPVMTANEQQKIADFYAQVRQAAVRSGGLPLTVRHLESILRMSIANAKMRLSSQVNRQDIDYAIATMLESFIQSQRSVVANSLGKKFGRFRALASSPFEMLDAMLSDILCQRSQELLQQRMHSDTRGCRDRVEQDDFATLNDAHVVLEEFTQMAASTHNLPPNFVTTYVNGSKFKKTFKLGMNTEGLSSIYSAGGGIDGIDEDINIDFDGSQTVET